jgi:hypothetical protein
MVARLQTLDAFGLLFLTYGFHRAGSAAFHASRTFFFIHNGNSVIV